MRRTTVYTLSTAILIIGVVGCAILAPDLTFIAAIATGIIIGIIAGLLPGIHPNLIASLTGIAALSLIIDGMSIAAFLVSMGITHIIVEAVPSVFLNAPEGDLADATTPAQRLVAIGGGIEAVRLTIGGALAGLCVSMLTLPLLMRILPTAYNHMRPYLAWTLPALAAILILNERTWQARLGAAIVFFVSGIIGTTVLSWTMHEPLLPLLSGLFGMPGLLARIGVAHTPPAQHDTDILRLPAREHAHTISAGVLTGSFLMLLPGAGPSQMATIARRIARNVSGHGFLALLGSLAAADFVASLGAMASLHKARSGVLEEAAKWLGVWDASTMLLLCMVALASAGIAALIALKIANAFGTRIHLLPQRHIALGALLLVVALTSAMDGPRGILVLAIAGAAGHLAPRFEVARSHAMGCLLIPTILFFWGLRPGFGY